MENVLRSISIFSKNESEFLLGQVLLPEIDIEELNKIIVSTEDDPQYYYCYLLTEETLSKFLDIIPDYHSAILKIDFETYEYYLEASNIG